MTELIINDEVISEEVLTEASRNQTAKKATAILVEKNIGFAIPTAKQKKNLLIAFAEKNKVIYGKAFDAIRTTTAVNLDNVEQVRKNLDKITLYEIKSTNKSVVTENWDKYFFSLSTAELLVAQNLKDQYKFAFVNTLTKDYVELTLTEIFAKAKGIYPTWSIMF